MVPKPAKAFVDYGASVAVTVLAVLIRALFDPLLDDKVPFITLLPAIACATWIGGVGSGFLSIGMSALASAYFFMTPRYSVGVDGVANQVGLALFLLIGAGLVAIVESLRRSKRALQEREQEFQLLAESIPQMAWTANPDGHVFWYNRRWYEYTGTTLQEMEGWGWTSVHDPTQLPQVLEKWNSSISTGKPFEMVFPIRGQDGIFRPFLTRIVPVQDREGKIVRWVGTNTDVTDTKAAEDRLRASEAHLKAVLDTLAAFVGILTPDGILIGANKSALMTVGLPSEELFGKPLQDLYPWADLPEEKARLIAAIRKAKTGVASRYDAKVHVAEERLIDIDFMLHPMIDSDGQITHLIPSAIDITDRKNAESLLRDSEERMRLATEATEVGIWEWNVITDDLRWDAQMFRIYGMERTSDGFVRYHTWSDAVLAEDLLEQEAQLAITIQQHSRGSREFRIHRWNDGEVRIIQSVETVRLTEAGEVEWVIGTNLDVTDIRQAENKLRQLASELAENDRRKDEFLATLSHELRNPLAPIRNGLQLLKISSGDAEAVQQSVQIMERQLSQLIRLVDDLMDVSRINRGKIELCREHVLLADIVQDAIETSRPVIDQMKHELTVNLPDHPAVLIADATRLAQVISNLLNNAAKYTERGGHIWLSAETQGNELTLTVRDNGIGIAADQLPQLFTMFSQLNNSLDRSQGGLGIGLMLVRRLVEMHGGTIEAKSEGLSKGTEFVISLPVLTDKNEPRTTIIAENPSSVTGSLRVLIVDDNRDSADTLAKLLAIKGHETKTAYDGAEAIEVATDYQPDVILLDLGLPKMDGCDVCRRIRQQAWGRKTAIVAQTGWGQDGDRKRTAEAGFDYHLVKPLVPSQLLDLLADLQPAKT